MRIGREPEQLADQTAAGRRLTALGLRLQILNAQDLDPVDDRGGDLTDLTGLTQPDSAQQLARTPSPCLSRLAVLRKSIAAAE
jgi:hypothetical protein